MKKLNPRTFCADGVSLSIQAGQYLYSAPREDVGPYYKVEVGFIKDSKNEPLAPPDSWSEYGDGEFPSNVYGYVPVELVEKFIADHGGLVSGGEIPS